MLVQFPSLQPKVFKFNQVLNLAILCGQVRKTWVVVSIFLLHALSLHFSQGELIHSHSTLCILGKKPTLMFAEQTFLLSSTFRVSYCLLDYSPCMPSRCSKITKFVMDQNYQICNGLFLVLSILINAILNQAMLEPHALHLEGFRGGRGEVDNFMNHCYYGRVRFGLSTPEEGRDWGCRVAKHPPTRVKIWPRWGWGG